MLNDLSILEFRGRDDALSTTDSTIPSKTMALLASSVSLMLSRDYWRAVCLKIDGLAVMEI